MVWTIARRELVEHLKSLRFLMVTLLVIALAPLAIYVGARDYEIRLADYNRGRSEQAERVARQGTRGLIGSSGERLLLRALRAPEPLSVLVRGLDGALPAYWDFTEAGLESGPPPARARRVADVLGSLDLEFLVRVALGLLAILLAFDTVAGEKELGTLRAVFSHPVRRGAFLAGKLVGGLTALLVPLVLLFLLALLSGRAFGAELLAGGAPARVALLAVSAAAYLVGLYALGLLISSLASSQKTALIALLAAWVLAVLAAMPLATLAAQAVAPAPPDHAVEAQKQVLSTQMSREAWLAMGKVFWEITGLPEGHMNTGLYWKHKEAIDQRTVPILLSYLSRRRQLLSELERDQERRQARQNEWAGRFMALSPAGCFAKAAAELAGTGDAHYRAWQEAARRQQARLNSALFDDPPMITFADQNAAGSVQRRPGPKLASLPGFVPPRRDAAAALERALPNLALLLVYAGSFLAAAFVAFSRYDVR